MERGGFHGYQKTPNTSSATTGAGAGAGLKLSEINMRLAEMNQYTTAVGKTPNTNVVNNTNNLSSNTTPSSTITTSSDDNECTVREQDRFMPIANVIRIMRKILPPHAKISDDAKETIQECVSEYISFITGEANERCQREQRKTITAEDVLWAMSKLGFDDYIEPLTLYLHRYREMEGDRGMSMRSEALVKGATSSSSSRAIDHHQYYAQSMAAAFHGHGFFGYLKASDASTSNNHINVNATAGVSSGSSTQLQPAAASAALPNGDHHQPHAQDHRV